jgi:uncharacterized damage-inducible protein DinB
MKRLLFTLLLACLIAIPAAAQPSGGAAPAPDAASKALKASFDTIARYIAASAEKMPEENFAFKPTPEVMSFGQLVGHVANTHFSYCSRVKGEKNPNDGNDIQQKTSKADIAKGLADSIAYCAAVYSDMTDAKLLEPLPAAASGAPPSAQAPAAKTPPPPQPPQLRLNRLLGNVTHDWEHYGNLVTYLRIKGLVPPSSERR